MQSWPFGPAWRSSLPQLPLVDVSDVFEEAPVIEPIDPFESGEFNGFDVSTWSAPVDHLGLVESVDAFGQGVVVTVPDAAH